MGLVGVIVAVLVLAPEAMGALQATMRNRLQRAVNIALGSVLATIGLTIPAVLVLGVLKGTPTVLGLGAGADGAARRHARRLDAHLRRRPHQHAAVGSAAARLMR